MKSSDEKTPRDDAKHQERPGAMTKPKRAASHGDADERDGEGDLSTDHKRDHENPQSPGKPPATGSKPAPHRQSGQRRPVQLPR